MIHSSDQHVARDDAKTMGINTLDLNVFLLKTHFWYILDLENNLFGFLTAFSIDIY